MKFWHRFSTATLSSLLAGAIALTMLWPGGRVLAADQCGSDSFDSVSAPTEYIGGPTVKYTLEQPFGGKADIENLGEYIQTLYQFALGIVGIMAVVLIMFGGLRWLAAAGNESAISDAKEIITSAVTGLVIALLSYTILAFINPQTLDTSVSVFKIPVPVACDYDDPETKTIPDMNPGLEGNGHSLCSGAVVALQDVVNLMLYGEDGQAGPQPGNCPGCTLDVSSGVRTHERQAELRDCYDRAVLNGVTDGSSCPQGCDTCNLAEKVCCSKHEHAKAVDIALTNVPTDRGMAATSDGFRKASQNNGGAGGNVNLSSCVGVPDEALCATQRLTNQVMTATGKFKGVSSEWWHFEFTGDCGAEVTACTEVTNSDGKKVANNAYCSTSIDGTTVYRAATCTGGVAGCETNFGGYNWYVFGLVGECDETQFTGEMAATPSQTYLTKPSCYTAPDYEGYGTY